MQVAIVHDWLYTIGGAERVLRSMLRCFPGARLHALVDLLGPEDRQTIGYEHSRTSFLQRMPLVRRNHRVYLPLMPLAVEQFDLRGYDLVISSSYAVAKGVITGPDQLHVSYVHSPMRYAWDLQPQYLQESRLETGLRSWLARSLLHRMRIWDTRTASGVDRYIANSGFVARRILKIYGRGASVIHPPVRVPSTLRPTTRNGFFLTASRLVPYKNTRVIIEAFRDLPDQRLVVVGDGPELSRLRELAGPNVEMLGFVEDGTLRDLMGRASAFVFAAEEDFGITVVEAQAAGTPVIALGRGGVRETIITDGAAPTGLFFAAPEPGLVADAVRRFLREPGRYRPVACHANALRFSEERFEREFRDFIKAAQAAFEIRKSFTPAAAMVSEDVYVQAK